VLIDDFIKGQLGFEAEQVYVYPSGQVSFERSFVAVYPGSWNPRHAGHLELRNAAERYLDEQVEFELSVLNVDKPALTAEDVVERLRQFNGHDGIILTRAATFAEKAELFPGCVFVVGADTAARVVDPRYGDLDAAFDTFARRFCWFLVGARILNGVTMTLNDLMMPERYHRFFTELPLSMFAGSTLRSSELR